MKKTFIAATLAAALTLPAHAGDVIQFERPDGQRMEFDFDFDLDLLDLDMDLILAQADEDAAKARARAREEQVRAREEAARAREEAARTRGRAREDAAHAREEAARAREDARAHAEDMAEWSKQWSADFSNSMMYMFTDRAGRSSRVVKGAPYSADIVTETNQTLPDGNVITHKSVNKVWRDGEGRTRQETYRGDKVRSIYISDPVAGMTYTLLPERKIAIQVPRIDLTKHMVAPRVHVEPRIRGRTSTTTTETSSDGKRVIVRTIDADGAPGVRDEVRVQVVRVDDDTNIAIAPTPPTPATPPTPPTPPIAPLPPMPVIPGVHTLRFESTSHLGKGETKALAARDIDGVKAEGRSTTWTIPAGQIGNQKPILVTSESWYSPDLQVTMYSRYNDPRTGESLYRLASLKRAEPAADLFRVPEGYTMKGNQHRAPRARENKDKPKDK